MLKTDRKRLKRGNVLTNFDNLHIGESFLTYLKPKTLTAYSAIYQKRIKTEILLCINPKTLIAEKITKVTIL